jgi:hypothetical protein
MTPLSNITLKTMADPQNRVKNAPAGRFTCMSERKINVRTTSSQTKLAQSFSHSFWVNVVIAYRTSCFAIWCECFLHRASCPSSERYWKGCRPSATGTSAHNDATPQEYKVVWHDVLTNLLSLFCTCYLLFITFSMSHDTFHGWVTLDIDFYYDMIIPIILCYAYSHNIIIWFFFF